MSSRVTRFVRIEAKRAHLGMLATLAALLFSACDGSESLAGVDPQVAKPTVASVRIVPDSADLEVGQSLQFTTKMYDASGNEVTRFPGSRGNGQGSPAIRWTSSDTTVTKVADTGLVTAVAGGKVVITASVEGRKANARVNAMSVDTGSQRPEEGEGPLPTDSVSGEELPPVTSVTLNPETLELLVGESGELKAAAFDADRNELPRPASDYAWSSSDEDVAKVSETGRVSAVSQGEATITASLEGQSATTGVSVSLPAEHLPPMGAWDFVLQDTLVRGNLTVSEGETWLFGPSVEVEGNVIVRGTLAMRPGSSLKLLGADPDRYVGGGMAYDPMFDNDIGLWVTRTGALDIQGTPKKGWTRTGAHPTWGSGDEYYIAPTAVGDTEVRRWYPGDGIPQVDPRVPSAEVVNVTRDIVIEGPGHIHIHSARPQRIEYVELRELGVSNSASEGPVLGRYALHLHHGEDGTRGTIIRGVSAVNSGGRVFVPHGSHGITMIDNVSVNSLAAGFWWDVGDDTNDLLVDSMAVLGVHMPRSLSGKIPSDDAFTLGSGLNIEIRNSVAAGARGSKISTGFGWTPGGQTPNPVWTFDQGNVAHNNEGPGLRFWTNLDHRHVVKHYVGYRNGRSVQPYAYAGIESGAYANSVSYEDVLMLDEHLFQQTNGKTDAGYRNLQIAALDAPAIVVGHRNLPGTQYLRYENCSLTPGAGHPKIFVTEGTPFTFPWRAHFVDCDITPDEIEFETLVGGNEGSHILIDHPDGRRWEIVIEGGRRIDRTR